RLYYKIVLRARDRQWEEEQLTQLCDRYAPLTPQTQILHAHSPNTPAVEKFLRQQKPSIVIARCKTLLKPSIFTIPSHGTFVLHPGICPEYRNAHGCFWALAKDDLDKVGMTLLRIDKGVDTGPVYGYFRCGYDETTDSHIIIQQKVVLDNLDALGARLLEIHAGQAKPLDTAGRPSGEWGQPWLTAFWAWRRRAARRKTFADRAPVP
ncbi:MAG TPA: formyltransferase family protein, partial [Gemmataceae bacterium]|nr:formyltransferase family protein [Gemmataceae bacterium]